MNNNFIVNNNNNWMTNGSDQIDQNTLSKQVTLPDEIILEIFKYVSYIDLSSCSKVSKTWQRISYDKSLIKKQYNEIIQEDNKNREGVEDPHIIFEKVKSTNLQVLQYFLKNNFHRNSFEEGSVSLSSPLWFLKEIVNSGRFPQIYFDIWIQRTINYKCTDETTECRHELIRYGLNKNRWEVKKNHISLAIKKTDSVILKIIINYYTENEQIGIDILKDAICSQNLEILDILIQSPLKNNIVTNLIKNVNKNSMLKDNTYLYTILYTISNIFESRVLAKNEYDYLNKFLNSTKENITMEEREKELIDSIISKIPETTSKNKKRRRGEDETCTANKK